MRRSLTETFWVNVERYQELNGVSDKIIAERLGIKRDSWREYHRMMQSPKLRRVEGVAKIFHIKPIDLLESWTNEEWKQMVKERNQ